jgi:hypothetical protein
MKNNILLSIAIVGGAFAVCMFPIFSGCNKSNESEDARLVRKEDIIFVPNVIKGAAYIVRLKTDSVYCDVYYWLDNRARVCAMETCGDNTIVLSQEQCDRLIDTYIKAEK